MTAPLRVAMLPARLADDPYLDRLTAALAAHGVEEVRARWLDLVGGRLAPDVDVVHVHWLQMVLGYTDAADPRRAALRYLRGLARMRRRGVAVVWTMHNTRSHERSSWLADRVARVGTTVLADAVMVHCESARRTVRRMWPGVRGLTTIPFPCVPATDATPARVAARAALGIDPEARLLVVPGKLRAYKDVAGTVRAFRRQARDRDRLAVVGAGRDPAVVDEVVTARGDDARVTLVLEHLDDGDLGRWLAAADVAVLPYRRVLTSGAAAMCLGHGLPVVAPRLGCLAEQVGDAGRLVDEGDWDSAVSSALRAGAVDLDGWAAAARRRAGGSSWAETSRRTAAVYVAATDAARRRR